MDTNWGFYVSGGGRMTKLLKVVGIVVMGLSLVPAAIAQSQNGTQNSTGTVNSSVTSTAEPPAPAPANTMSNPHIKPGTDYNHWDAYVGYAYSVYRPEFNSNGQTLSMNGGAASVTYYVNRWFGLTFDFGGARTGKCVDGPFCGGGPGKSSYNSILMSYMGGARFRWMNSSRFTPFFDVMAGGVHGTDFYNYSSGSTVSDISSNTFGMLAGAGFDVQLTPRFSWRAIETDYFLTHFDQPSGAASHFQNNIRVTTGLLFTFGRHPVMVNRPPAVSLSADKNSIIQGSGDSIHLHAAASDPDGDSLTYAWSTSCGSVQGSGADAQWTGGSAAVGNCTTTVRVDDAHGGNASASLDSRVDPKPQPKPPTMSCAVDRSSVMTGERVTLTATANSPDNFNLSYTWRANAGQVTGTGASVQFDTTGLAAGTYTITGRAEDGHGGAADCQASVTVQQPPPPPQASKLGECDFKLMNSSRVDNVCKRILDDAALRLQNDPKGSLVIVAYADPKEHRADKLSAARGAAAVKYLTSKGIDASRVSVRPGTGQAGAGAANRRMELTWVPAGATF
jgi:outer membrane protein OmpA-like peptidoglycan-associated protein